MSETSTLIGYQGRTLSREELALVPTPLATETHRPVPHHEVINALVETLGFRHIGVVHDEYAVSPDGMKMFGALDLATEMHGCRFSIGVRNSHDKTMRLAMTVGYRVFVCSNMAFSGDLAPVLDKSRDFSTGWHSRINSHPRQCHHNRLQTAGVRLRRLAEDYWHFSGPNLNALNNGADDFALGRPPLYPSSRNCRSCGTVGPSVLARSERAAI